MYDERLLGSREKREKAKMDQWALEDSFKKLYSNDESFKRAVDYMRECLFKPKRAWDAEFVRTGLLKLAARLKLPKLSRASFPVEPPRLGGEAVEVSALETKVVKVPFMKLRSFVPRIAQPKIDIEHGNKLVAVYITGYTGRSFGAELGRDYLVELTLVFKGEEDPDYGLYNTLWRLIYWGRVEDIETVLIYINEDGKAQTLYRPILLRLSSYNSWRGLAPSYSEEGLWWKGQHAIMEEQVRSWTLYVNTWNHALSFRDLIPSMDKVVLIPGVDVPLLEGSRLVAENDYSMLQYKLEHISLTWRPYGEREGLMTIHPA